MKRKIFLTLWESQRKNGCKTYSAQQWNQYGFLDKKLGNSYDILDNDFIAYHWASIPRLTIEIRCYQEKKIFLSFIERSRWIWLQELLESAWETIWISGQEASKFKLQSWLWIFTYHWESIPRIIKKRGRSYHEKNWKYSYPFERVKKKMAAEIIQLGMGGNMNIWTRGFKIPILLLTLYFLLIIEVQYLGWLDRGYDVILKKTENIPNLYRRTKKKWLQRLLISARETIGISEQEDLRLLLQSWHWISYLSLKVNTYDG